MKKIFRHWKIIYALCCLVFISWMVHVGGNEFDRINGQYRRLVRQLEPSLIRSAAVAELTAECRSEPRQRTGLEEDDCSTWASQVVEARMKEVAERHLLAKRRGTVKLVLFYTGFVAIFLLGPVFLLYLLIVAAILLYKNIKIVR
jgi:hypothetical protein